MNWNKLWMICSGREPGSASSGEIADDWKIVIAVVCLVPIYYIYAFGKAAFEFVTGLAFND